MSTPDRLYAGWWSGFAIRVRNVGDLPLTQVAIRNTLDRVRFDVRNVGPADYATGVLRWTIDRIAPGQELVLTFEARPFGGTAGSWLESCVTVTLPEGVEDQTCSDFLILHYAPATPTPTPTQQTPTPTLSPTPLPADLCPVCPNGVVFQSNRDGGDYDVYRMDVDGGNVTRLTQHQADDIQPTWSFDGARIAFATNRDGAWDIYRMNADGSGQTNVTNSPTSQDMAPSWSCDWIAFQSDRDGQWEIYKTDPNGLQQIRLTHNDASDQQPVWSPDGQWIAFQSDRDGQWEIYIMDANGGHVQRITNHPAADRHPTWSWDGQWIAFTSNRNGQDDIYKVHALGPTPGTGELVRLTDHLAADAHAAWMPYCEYIFFQSDRDENYEVYRMGYEGENQTNISQEPAWIDVLDLVPGDVPDALFDQISVDGVAVTYDLLANDLGGRDPGVIMEITLQPTHGTLLNDGDGTVTYTPAPGFVGQDVFAYRLTGLDGDYDETMVVVRVVAPATPDTPVLFIPMIMVL